jgi:hypothetical protein
MAVDPESLTALWLKLSSAIDEPCLIACESSHRLNLLRLNVRLNAQCSRFHLGKGQRAGISDLVPSQPKLSNVRVAFDCVGQHRGALHNIMNITGIIRAHLIVGCYGEK